MRNFMKEVNNLYILMYEKFTFAKRCFHFQIQNNKILSKILKFKLRRKHSYKNIILKRLSKLPVELKS